MSSEAAAAPAAGSTILTGTAPAGAVGNPSLTEPKAAPGEMGSGIDAAREAAARPEWAPEKFWDADKRTLRTEDLGKAYVNLEKLMGSEKVPVPKGEDDTDGWQRWYEASGVPKDEKDYEFKRPEKMPDGLGYDDELEANFRKAARANGLNKRQASALYDGFVKQQVDRFTAYDTSQKQAKAQVQADLMREHGGQYEQAIGMARSALDKYADPEYRKWLDESGAGNDPRVIRAWIRVGREMAGDIKLKGAPAPANTADIQKQISEFNSKFKDALYDREHPDHKMRVSERAKLYEAAYGDA